MCNPCLAPAQTLFHSLHAVTWLLHRWEASVTQGGLRWPKVLNPMPAGWQAPPAEAKDLFLQHAALEENYGLARSAMEVYDLAVRTVPRELRLPLYDLYLARASEFFGLGKVRLVLKPLSACTLKSASGASRGCSAGEGDL